MTKATPGLRSRLPQTPPGLRSDPALVELDPAPDRLVEEARRISQERVDEFLSEDAEDVFVCPERGIGSEAEVAGECHDRLAVCEEPQFPRVVRPNTKRVMLMLCQEDVFVLRRAATKRDVDPYEELAIWLGRESKPVKGRCAAICRNGATRESNPPSDGLRRLTGFEDRLGHRPHAAPNRAI